MGYLLKKKSSWGRVRDDERNNFCNGFQIFWHSNNFLKVVWLTFWVKRSHVIDLDDAFSLRFQLRISSVIIRQQTVISKENSGTISIPLIPWIFTVWYSSLSNTVHLIILHEEIKFIYLQTLPDGRHVVLLPFAPSFHYSDSVRTFFKNEWCTIDHLNRNWSLY